MEAYVKAQQVNLNAAGFTDYDGRQLTVDGVPGRRTYSPHPKCDCSAADSGCGHPLPRRLLLSGFLLTLAIAVVLVVGVQIFDATYAPAEWLVSVTGGEQAAGTVLIVHRLVATVALLFLIAQNVTGLRRRPPPNCLFRPVGAPWLATYVSALPVVVSRPPPRRSPVSTSFFPVLPDRKRAASLRGRPVPAAFPPRFPAVRRGGSR